MTDQEIAKAAGLSLSAIVNWRWRAGLRRDKRQNKPCDEPPKPVRVTDAPTPEELAGYKRRLRDWAGVS